MRTGKACGNLLASISAFAALGFLGSAQASLAVLYSFTGGGDGAYPEAGLIRDAAGNLFGTTTQGGASDEGTVFRLGPNGTEKVLHAFMGGGDGAFPEAALIADSAGNLYGTTKEGGADDDGTVFVLEPNGFEKVLHAFTGGGDGAFPVASLSGDDTGNLYGTTVLGGGTRCYGGEGCGTVFRLSPDGTETILHAFTGGSDGAYPEANLIRDRAGNLYGTASAGGANGFGTVFRLTPDGREKVLHAFTGSNGDGRSPVAGLARDKAGFLYGTTLYGGTRSNFGTVFKLAPDGTESTLHAFGGGKDGAHPDASLVRDNSGNLYSTTPGGNFVTGCASGPDCGIVFEVAPNGTETVPHIFRRRRHRAILPLAGLIEDGANNLYGTTYEGGSGTACPQGCGTVFILKR